MAGLKEKLQKLLRRNPDATAARLRRRKSIISRIRRGLPYLKLALFIAGYVWMLALPSPRLGRDTFIDENALQPGQVNTYWNWDNVHSADLYLAQLEELRDSNATSEQRASLLQNELTKLGLLASIQNYAFSTKSGNLSGTNVYSVFSAPRASGSEAMVISASWKSCTNEDTGALNLRGVSTVLALAGYLSRHSHWAKDIVFVIGDGYLDGMHAWLSSYHGHVQSNLEAEPLQLTSGVIWAALNIDYPGHSFSHLGIFYEGANGRLPNQDLINSFQRIARYHGGVPVVLYDHLNMNDHPERGKELEILPNWLPEAIKTHSEIELYSYQAKNVLRHVAYQAFGKPSGVHGLFHKYRVDAFTIFAVPAMGPHGFHAIGRIVESTLRTMNNLLERLHASFFFYIQTGPNRFIQIGNYLPSVILISVSMMFCGLDLWVSSGWIEDKHFSSAEKSQSLNKPLGLSLTKGVLWIKRSRNLLSALAVIVYTHLVGILLFGLMDMDIFTRNRKSISVAIVLVITTLQIPALRLLPKPNAAAPLSLVLQALNLCIASTLISVTSVLNFSLAALLAITLGIPLSCQTTFQKPALRTLTYLVYMACGLGWVAIFDNMEEAIWLWDVLGIWFLPFVCTVYTPLMLQAAISRVLPP